MNSTFLRCAGLCAWLILSLADPLPAAIISDETTYQPNLLIPDGTTLGVSDTRNLSSEIFSITEVRVSLKITGTPASDDAFNGDFYAYLTHDSGFAVLLNRVGRSAGSQFGYPDSGFEVTFADLPPYQDIHNYRLTAPISGVPLTGTWRSDGRGVSPFAVTDTTVRSAVLTSFHGLDPNGDWTLFVADVSPLGTARLASWRLEITGITIPEPSSALLTIVGISAWLACCRSAFPP